MRKMLGEKFFNRDAKIVARDLLGKLLVRRTGNKTISTVITETEAYDGPDDKASHASKGKTERTKTMFEKPCVFYVYLCYGMHYMLNVVVREKNYPAAVLIRGVAIIKLNSKNKKSNIEQLIALDGPGKITKFLKIDKKINGKKSGKAASLWFEESGIKIKKNNIKKTPRIGVDYAGPVWSAKKFRFILTNFV